MSPPSPAFPISQPPKSASPPPSTTRNKQTERSGDEEDLRRLKDQAYAFIDAGISIESGRALSVPLRGDELLESRMALEFYLRGRVLLEELLRRPPSLGPSEDLRGKVRPTLERVRERISVIQQFLAKKAVKKPLQAAASNHPNNSSGEHLLGQDLTQSIREQIILAGQIRVSWDEIAGLRDAKAALYETCILPLLRPDLFTGPRKPASGAGGVLLFGPPGTGKTMLAKAVAAAAKCTFIAVTAASLTSKFVGESEKIVRALFAVAREHQPAIVFIGNRQVNATLNPLLFVCVDEIDGLLSQRGEYGEHEASRRIKTEFLIQMDGLSSEGRILLLATTNRPGDLDEAFRRRFTSRVYVPLPDFEARLQLLRNILAASSASATTTSKSSSGLDESELRAIANFCHGYSASDICAVCRDAALAPLRDWSPEALVSVKSSAIRQVTIKDFEAALQRIKPSVKPESIRECEEWNRKAGAM